MTFNPYAHLASALRSQLRLEESMTAEDRRRASWMARVEFAGESMTVGKGDVNTIFWFRKADGKRHVGYPAEALAVLSKLARQAHVAYDVVSSDGTRRRTYSLDRALSVAPERGASVEGVDVDGAATVVRVARKNVAGKMAWLKSG